MKKKIIFSLAALAALVVCAQSIIMRIEMKDGTVRNIDTESVDEFNIIRLAEIPESQTDRYLTETLWDSTGCYSTGYRNNLTKNVKVIQKYIANDPQMYFFTFEGLFGTHKKLAAEYDSETGKFTVAPQYTGIDDPTYGAIWVADEATFAKEVDGSVTEHGVRNSINGIDGFNLYLYYYAPNYGDGKTYCVRSSEYIPSPDAKGYTCLETYEKDNNTNYKALVFKTENDYAAKLNVQFTYHADYNEPDDLDMSAYETLDLTEGNSHTILIAPQQGKPYIAYRVDAFDVYGNLISSTSRYTEYIDGVFESGRGVYYYSAMMSSTSYNPITFEADPNNPAARTFTISDWFYGVDFAITCDDWTPDSDGHIKVSTPAINTGATAGGAALMCQDVHAWLKDRGLESMIENYDASYYDTRTGTFYLNLVYYPYSDEPSTSIYTIETERFQMDGYPSYNVSIAYDSTTLDANGDATALFNVFADADVAKLKAVMIKGDDVNQALKAITNGDAGVAEFDFTGRFSISFPVSDEGQYTVAVMSFDNDGNAQQWHSCNFNYTDNKNWADLGLCDYRDGWIIPAFGVDNLNFIYKVAVQVDKNNSNHYRLINPYSDESPAADYNICNSPANIEFYIIDGMPIFEPQRCGFGIQDYSEDFVIGNNEGYYYKNGYSIETIRQIISTEAASTFEDGVVTVTKPVFEGWGENVGQFGYSWSNAQPTQIFMPGTPAAAKAKAVARPEITGASVSIQQPERTLLVRDIRTSKPTTRHHLSMPVK